MLASRTGALNVVATFFTGSRIGRTSELCRDPTNGPYVHGGESPVARDQIVEILFLVHPITQRDDDVAFDALRSCGLANGSSPFATRSIQSP